MATSKCPPKPFTNKLDTMLRKIIPFLMRHETAKPFLRPVDYVAYQLPDYPKIIMYPIDLSTIKERLIRKYYASIIMCLNDFNIMLENCFIYNLPDDPIISFGLKLRKLMSSKLEIMPSEEFRLVKNAKRHSVPSKPIEMSEFEKCSMLINELMSPKYKAMNYLFLKPVDVHSLGLTDYHDFIKCPIDLSTIKSYLEARLYDNRTTFINDIYLMLNNCIVYNGSDTGIGILCRRFRVDFENLYFSIFKEKCRENVNDEIFYFLMKIKRKHKQIEEMIRLNTEKIAIAREKIDLIVNMFAANNGQFRQEKKRKMLIKFPQGYLSPKDSMKSAKKKRRLMKNSYRMESDVY